MSVQPVATWQVMADAGARTIAVRAHTVQVRVCMSKIPYTKGVHEVGEGVFAYLQPDGGWWLNNAGLIVNDEATLLVDTLFNPSFTREMLDGFARLGPAARRIDTVVNTHANGDHCWGNQVVEGAEIVASRRSAAEMAQLPPRTLSTFVKAARATQKLGAPGRVIAAALGKLGVAKVGALGRASAFVSAEFGRYDFDGIDLRIPTRTFDGELSLEVGGCRVDLIEVGPAHTQGDTLVHVPGSRVLFTGDILFVEAHPIVWAGPVSNWVRACDRIEALDVDVIVAGHGRLATKADVRAIREYLVYLEREARIRYDAGMSAHDAARDISLDGFSTWSEAERVSVNVGALYREFSGTTAAANVIEEIADMGELWAELQAAG